MTDDTIACCPECESSNLSVASRGSMSSPVSSSTDRGRYRCGDCRETFDDPAERAPKKRGGGSQNRVDLLDADPEEWP